MKKLAVRYFFPGDSRFIETAEPYLGLLTEVSFPWPGIKADRPLRGDAETLRKIIIADLEWCRARGLALDLLLNAGCYGQVSSTGAQRMEVLALIDGLDARGLKPDSVTTTSPYIAQIVRRFRPGIAVRAASGMRLNHLTAFEYLADCFDSFFAGGDVQRDRETLAVIYSWCRENGKELCLAVNSGCLRCCPWRTFHEMLESHDPDAARRDSGAFGFQPLLCEKFFDEQRLVEFLRGSWIRPEDVEKYGGLADVFMISTLSSEHPGEVIGAYVSRRFEGDLFRLLDPGFPARLHPARLENSAFPVDWAESGVAGKCAINCVHCGRCEKVLAQILRPNPASAEIAG